jgi:serine/threonine-protein kinase HipA
MAQVIYPKTAEIKVGLDFGEGTIPVGRLAIRAGKIYFEYDRSLLNLGIEISPLRLPLQSGVRTFSYALFEGLPGVFNDSLPDGWGRLLLDRSMRSKNILPEQLTPLDRLAYVGKNGMGALVFEPYHAPNEMTSVINLDLLASQATSVLEGEADNVLQELLSLNGSSAGARPKVVVGIDQNFQKIIHGKSEIPTSFQHWIIKFSNLNDGLDAGAIEYVYALMAKDAGIDMTDIHLFPASKGAGYFATKRFDRNHNQRFHAHTAGGLLHVDFRTPSLDYEDLIALTGILTRDVREVEKIFRLAVFNVLSLNRDDHAKNFTFLMDSNGKWKFSPAYDLTFSSGPRGEQSTMVMGMRENPRIEHLIALGKEAKLNLKKINDIIENTKQSLSNWPKLAEEYGVAKPNISLIWKRISDQIAR